MKFLNKNEYWLLDLVVKGSFPLYRLVDPDLELIANRDGHGLSHTELLDTLHQLFQENSLICIRFQHDETITEIVPTYQEIDSTLRAQDHIQYRLTALGGKQWEALSSPNWDHFIDDSYPNNEVVIKAQFRQVAEQYLQVLPCFDGSEVIPESIRCNVLSPWQATYWKTLPEGYEVNAQTRKTRFKPYQDMSSEGQKLLCNKENWYTNPFKTK